MLCKNQKESETVLIEYGSDSGVLLPRMVLTHAEFKEYLYNVGVYPPRYPVPSVLGEFFIFKVDDTILSGATAAVKTEGEHSVFYSLWADGERVC